MAAERLFRPAGVAALSACGVVLLLIVASSAWIAGQNHQRLALVEQAEGAQAMIATVLSSVETAETGQRGYLLTGRETYLAPYQEATRILAAQLTELRSSLGEIADAVGVLDALDATVRDKLAELAATLELYRSGDVAGARSMVLTDRGQKDMDAVRSLLRALAERQRAIAKRYTSANDRANYLLVVIDSVAFAVVVGLGLLVALAARRSMAVLRAAQAELTEANARLAGLNKTLEETVARRTADLSEANEEIQRFAYIVSHDLRAPLVNIMGFTGELEVAGQALRRFTDTLPQGLPEDVRVAAHGDLPEAIHFIRASTSKMDRLIAAILRISREGQRTLSPEPLTMRTLLHEIAETLHHQAEQGAATIVIESVPDIVADKLTIEQIFSNLLENALKYTQPGRPGRIIVSGRASGRLARYDVTDNGRGIAAQDRQRIFELFRRAGDQTQPGEGIGLAHVRALVRRLGGRIECESTPGEGSVFRVYLPLQAGGSGSQAKELQT